MEDVEVLVDISKPTHGSFIIVCTECGSVHGQIWDNEDGYTIKCPKCKAKVRY